MKKISFFLILKALNVGSLAAPVSLESELAKSFAISNVHIVQDAGGQSVQQVQLSRSNLKGRSFGYQAEFKAPDTNSPIEAVTLTLPSLAQSDHEASYQTGYVIGFLKRLSADCFGVEAKEQERLTNYFNLIFAKYDGTRPPFEFAKTFDTVRATYQDSGETLTISYVSLSGKRNEGCEIFF